MEVVTFIRSSPLGQPSRRAPAPWQHTEEELSVILGILEAQVLKEPTSVELECLQVVCTLKMYSWLSIDWRPLLHIYSLE